MSNTTTDPLHTMTDAELAHVIANPLDGIDFGPMTDYQRALVRRCAHDFSTKAAATLGTRMGDRMSFALKNDAAAGMRVEMDAFRAEGWRVIKAKFGGRCPITKTRWVAGGYVWWRKGAPAQAVDCLGRYVEAYGNCMLVGL